MGNQPSTSTPASTPHSKSPAMLVFATAMDTTWRMFVPILGLLVLGIWTDKSLGTTPWLTVVFLILGIILAVILVRDQFLKVKS